MKYHRIFITGLFIAFITLNGPPAIAGIDDFLKGIKKAVGLSGGLSEGKIIEGLFFPDWFEHIQNTMESEDCSFHAAESEFLGGTVGHGYIGGLLLRKSQMPDNLVRAVHLHHVPGDAPEALTSLVHVADNLVTEIGLAAVRDVAVEYERAALDKIKLRIADVRRLRDQYRTQVIEEVTQLVDQCMS